METTHGSPQDPSTKLFLGGLPPGVTNEDLRQHFETFGKVDEAVVKQPPGNGSSQFGFLWVRPAEAVQKIMAVDHTIHCASGYDVTIPAPVLARNKRVTERSSTRPAPDPRAAPDKIFVGGLSSATTVAAYRALFEEFGAVKDAVIMQDRLTNRSRGFGFVIFEDPASTTAVLSQQAGSGIHIDGKRVEVKPALPKEILSREEARAAGGHAREQQRALQGLRGHEGYLSPPQERIEFAEGLQHVETYMGYMPPPSADEHYLPPAAFGRGVALVPNGAGPPPNAQPVTVPLVPVPTHVTATVLPALGGGVATSGGFYVPSPYHPKGGHGAAPPHYGLGMPPGPYGPYRPAPMPPYMLMAPGMTPHPGAMPPVGSAMQGVPVGDPVLCSRLPGYGPEYPLNPQVFYPPLPDVAGFQPLASAGFHPTESVSFVPQAQQVPTADRAPTANEAPAAQEAPATAPPAASEPGDAS